MKITEQIHAQLIAPGQGEVVNVGSIQPARVDSVITLASVDTNVVIQYELDTESGFTDPVKTLPVTLTANGVYVIPVPTGDYKYIRPSFVSESGGTAATLDIVTKTYN